MSTADIGVVGLAVMGSNLARNFARHGFTVAVYNRTHAKTTELIEAHGDEGDFVPSEALEDFVASLKRPRKAMIMVQAGNATDAVIDQLAALMEPGDMIIDGGNAHFENTRRREAALREQGLHFVGTGVSGGEEGALLGPAIMPGGSAESYESLGPILEAIAAKAPDGTPCCTRLGPDGAGHFVKMVHNGIEYSDMQLIGEAYDLLRRGVGIEPADLAKIFSEWNAGELDSYLIEVTAEVLGHTDAATGKPLVDVIVDQAGQKGTGRWTVQNALDLGVPVTGIAEATFARALSSGTRQREGAVDLLTGPTGKVDFPADFVEDVRQALYASKIVAYAQGFDQIAAASAEYDWGIDLGSCSALWRAGCIIRARFLDRITEAWRSDPELPTLLAAPEFTKIVTDAQDAWRRVVSTAALAGIPTPGFSSALAYYDGLRSRRLPAALIQGQRDFFGAHTYKRVDREGTFHTDWSGDRNEIEL
ncbi:MULTISPECIES: NADP-dependent phosphogluconate dehydrogenase [Glycomyces]|uniref:6-phosphogluconate dehydrogenase, decarboxylating n=2 Tax=Glycomyces TaxID=58113 RepID=A0A9X3PMP4_9ACTN|nr:NADP-dependent phosphogluconate dehydrogenase [Glycomyces lechevalierae]MDA1386388.1 NADP-dependent phosphogluconate dehydrogenase [Glycomyces lechevalierae]MDR7338904.1 6-phosphogluconate dehydrogenase [Glycomyces lechevalierae]